MALVEDDEAVALLSPSKASVTYETTHSGTAVTFKPIYIFLERTASKISASGVLFWRWELSLSKNPRGLRFSSSRRCHRKNVLFTFLLTACSVSSLSLSAMLPRRSE